MMRKRFNRIQFKITLGMLIILGLSLSILGYLTIHNQRQQLLNNINIEGEQLLDFLAKTSQAPIIGFRFYLLREYALTLEQFPHVAFCEIYDEQGSSLVQMESSFTDGS